MKRPLQPITMTACNRPKYTERVIRALEQCSGIDECILLVRIDPGCDEVARIVSSFSGNMEFRINPFRLGCNANTLFAIHEGFARSRWNIHIEDDTVPARDALEFLFWARDRGAPLASCYRAHGHSDAGNLYGALSEIWFFPWVWGCSLDQWRAALPAIKVESPHSWDTQANTAWMQQGLLRQVVPACARSCNIGAIGGVHVPSEEWHTAHHLNADWAGCLQEPPCTLRDEWWLSSTVMSGVPEPAPKRPSRGIPSWRRSRRSTR